MPPFTIKSTAEEIATALKDEIRGKNILITGISPSSLGEETIRVLAPYANLIIAASRNKEKTQKTVDRIVANTPSANIKVIVLDLASISSIKLAAKEVNEPIHVLINNAAVPMTVELTRTTDGFESQFGSNHLGHFLLTSLLLSNLKAAADGGEFAPRVINIASLGHRISGIRFDDPNFTLRPKEYNKWIGYSQSKSANILFSYQFAKRFGKENLLSFSVHPGAIVETTIGGAVPREDHVAMGLIKPDGTYVDPDSWKPISVGTATHIVAAFDPSIKEHNGSYLSNAALAQNEVAPHAQDPVIAEKLWAVSEELISITF